MKKTTKKIKRVAIFGDGEAGKNDKHFRDAIKDKSAMNIPLYMVSP